MERIIHNIWIGPYEMPDMPKYFIERSKQINKTYKHILWTDQNLPQLPDKIKQLMDFHYKNGKYALAADILRVCVVNIYGGLYIDVDTKPINSIDNIDIDNYDAILPYHDEYTFTNTFFGCAKNSGYINHLYNLLLNRSHIGQDFMPYWFNSGVKEYFNIKSVDDYSSEECKRVGREMLNIFDNNRIFHIAINGDFKKYYEHFGMYSWSDHHKKLLDEGDINYMENVYNVQYISEEDDKIRILKATYGGVDVKDIVDKKITNNKLEFGVNNDTFWDTKPFVVKNLEIEIDDNGKIFKYVAFEGENFYYPRKEFQDINTLVLTSSNRIEQVILAIAINKEILKKDFNLIVADCSTPNLDVNSAIKMHKSDDPYNLVNESNYCSNYQLIEEYVKTVPKIKNFMMIHVSPRFEKQKGEAMLTSLGLNAAALMGSEYAVKLTGVCILKYDIFQKIDEYFYNKYAVTWKRTGFNDQKSTRVFGCNPKELNRMLLTAGHYEWYKDYDFIERKFERILNEKASPDKINHLNLDERDIIVDEGVKREDHRKIITENLNKYNLLDSNDIWIRKFLDGGIW